MVTLDKCPILTLDEIHHRHWETASEEKPRAERGPEVSISRDTQVTSCSLDPPEWPVSATQGPGNLGMLIMVFW